MSEELRLQRISTRRFVRGEYTLGQPFIVQHRGVDTAFWLPVEETPPHLLAAIVERMGIEDVDHE